MKFTEWMEWKLGNGGVPVRPAGGRGESGGRWDTRKFATIACLGTAVANIIVLCVKRRNVSYVRDMIRSDS